MGLQPAAGCRTQQALVCWEPGLSGILVRQRHSHIPTWPCVVSPEMCMPFGLRTCNNHGRAPKRLPSAGKIACYGLRRVSMTLTTIQRGAPLSMRAERHWGACACAAPMKVRSYCTKLHKHDAQRVA